MSTLKINIKKPVEVTTTVEFQIPSYYLNNLKNEIMKIVDEQTAIVVTGYDSLVIIQRSNPVNEFSKSTFEQITEDQFKEIYKGIDKTRENIIYKLWQ